MLRTPKRVWAGEQKVQKCKQGKLQGGICRLAERLEERVTEEKRIKVCGGDLCAALRQKEEMVNKMTVVMFMQFMSPDLCFASSIMCTFYELSVIVRV